MRHRDEVVGAGRCAEGIGPVHGRNLLPDIEKKNMLIQCAVDMGTVGGTTGGRVYHVDGLTTEENGLILGQLWGLVDGAIG